MTNESIETFHIADFNDFTRVCVENDGLAFPELKKIMEDYILSQDTMEFKECWIRDEQVEQGEVRTVLVNFLDTNPNYFIRLRGSKNKDNDQVLTMKVDAVDLNTEEVVYERQLA
ncbi:hypothetical protein SAMN05192559_102385 [Halobacillus karajensis]|uniref:Uncharacterized protein n=2 Tax=Halobacillus karajensis TaxID=195088 RepID=A0A024P7C0_9BACI|nr:hypothetical protein [Halobacillus karajensis]CDQ17821.1 hypothetical protein BN982_00059 [Halobacillus karajensis]CDQ24227.1 hypothetical protein BN983_02499 [Halobacillus karajensis]CDQ29524.1 hypothetical protein BN981_03907 [Halobacillus karajensis]SEH63248.1 hypothetical protein SAMN05192559_102385 [Halobacillus karajensis]